MLYDAIMYPDKLTIKKCIVTGFLLLLLCMLRNNGFYLLLVLLPFLLITLRKNKTQMLKLFIVIFIPLFLFKIVYTGFIFNALNIRGGSVAEMMSIPFQQTARYITEYPDDITEEEETAILNVLSVPSVHRIAKLYNPTLADYVKNRYNQQATSEELKEYIKVWCCQLVRHPDAYAEAFFNMTYSWFSFENKRGFSYYSQSNERVYELFPDIPEQHVFSGYRNALWQFLRLLRQLPFTAFLFKSAFYTWMFIALLFIMLCRKKYREIISCGLIYLNYLICFIGPIGYLRYALPMIVCIPFVMFIAFKREPSNTLKSCD